VGKIGCKDGGIIWITKLYGEVLKINKNEGR
jgi:hypothetical protein